MSIQSQSPELRTEPKRDTPQPVQQSREAMYEQRFHTYVHPTTAPSGFFHQVNGYGVQLFSQASNFRGK